MGIGCVNQSTVDQGFGLGDEAPSSIPPMYIDMFVCLYIYISIGAIGCHHFRVEEFDAEVDDDVLGLCGLAPDGA